jgi:hypothetical protein
MHRIEKKSARSFVPSPSPRHHVNLALPSGDPGSTANIRITSVHVHTPRGGEYGVSAMYTL